MKIWIAALALFTIMACQNTAEKPAEVALPDAETALLEVQKTEAALFEDTIMNPEKGWAAFGIFRSFARNYPQHPLAPSYHMKAAAIARNIPGKALMAIEEYMTVYKTYPQDSLAIQAEFLVGFTFDQALNDKERATKAYNHFIDQHAEHPLAQEARGLVALLNEENTLDQVKSWEASSKK